ncbi:SCO4225 family membrane protein [Streptomyces sp. SP18CS02]|uniref:SCO4225 family membrane protein n=1 Tax=Streptomyces sp. SP18CS02 TaxID=3002531 RepID=UPI002E77D82F|nr:hypothetical protein [Streptomyces sp. SP18CS02]MEE1757274.1 hypothetical protein [Streptomyces sp. SP18CS02]
MPNASRPRRLPRRLLALATDNWLARGYLVVAGAALGFFLYAVFVASDPGFAGIWPLLATAPFSVVALLAATPAMDSSPAWLHPLVFSAGVALSALINAVLLGGLARLARGRDARPTA